MIKGVVKNRAHHSLKEKKLLYKMMVSSPNFSNQSYPVPQPGRAPQLGPGLNPRPTGSAPGVPQN